MDARSYHEHVDPHHARSQVSDVILGGQDGLVNVLGVLLGVAGAATDSRIVIVAGVAAGLAESLSMAGVAFTTRRTDRALYESERARELRHIRVVPELERDDVRAIFARQGLRGPLLDTVVTAITSNPSTGASVMMADELGLSPVAPGADLRAAAVVGVASMIGSAVPLLPFLFLAPTLARLVSLALSTTVLLALGAYRARATSGSRWKAGLELALVGIATAVASHAIGRLFRATP